jgi:hypothetical protein
MDLLLISLVAFGASVVTFYSGFGLGTILTPVFILFFPIEIAIALTGIVHFLNNIFKSSITFRHINWRIALKFSLTAILFSWLGSWVLSILTNDVIIYQYYILGFRNEVTLIKLSMSLLMILFVLIELIPSLKKITFGEDKIYIGGALSGFFGGLAGFQGALRSMFLIKLNLTKEAYIATGIFIASMIDITRLFVYFKTIEFNTVLENSEILIFATLSAFLGAFIGNRMLKKITIEFVQNIVSILLLILALLLALGVI